MTFTRQMKNDLIAKMREDMGGVFGRIIYLARSEGASEEELRDLALYAAVAGLSAYTAATEGARGVLTERDLDDCIDRLRSVARAAHFGGGAS